MTVSRDRPPPLARLHDWYSSPLGREVARLESGIVQRLLSNTFGYYLVQLGGTESFRDALTSSRIRHRISVPCGWSSGVEGTRIIAHAAQLPLANDSIDAILLPHILDFTEDPHDVLGEVERVLIPEGRAVIVGFNAWSVWGLRRLFRSSRDQMPWCGRFHSSSQVEAWLVALGFAVETREYILFCPPLRGMQGRWCGSLDSLGQRFWPGLGGVYVIRAVKRVATLTPLKPAWWRRRSLLAGSAVEPSTRGTGHA
jgi:SAM-dependent methyltransferase